MNGVQDALRRSVLVSQNMGVRAMLVHALNDRARQFYEHYGFKASHTHPERSRSTRSRMSRLM